MQQAIERNADTYKRVSAYVQTVNGYNKQIEDLAERMTKLYQLYEKMEKELEEWMKKLPVHHALIQRAIKRSGQLAEEMSGTAERIRSLQESREKLYSNPDRVVETDDYKRISSEYNQAMGKEPLTR
ncbi:hypothetical protein JQN58_00805 [Aneurinibacillus sp. BA2021]|nr:hypothetical protein [Aneurinibacillus sp. BA2021]